MKIKSTAQALKSLETMDAKTFEATFASQITVLDQDNCRNANDGMFNIIFEGKAGDETSILFCDGIVIQVSESAEA
jgi:hypothetical protein